MLVKKIYLSFMLLSCLVFMTVSVNAQTTTNVGKNHQVVLENVNQEVEMDAVQTYTPPIKTITFKVTTENTQKISPLDPNRQPALNQRKRSTKGTQGKNIK